MMDLCPVAADQQNSKLNEFVLVSRRIRKAGRGAQASSPTVRKSSSIANGFLVFASPEYREALPKLISPFSGDAIGKEGRIASSVHAFLVASQDLSKLQLQGTEAQASPARSDGDGESRGDLPQQSTTTFTPLEIAIRIWESKPKSSGVLRTHQVRPKGDSSLPRKSNFSSVPAGLGRNSKGSETAAARQMEKNNLSVAKAKAPGVKNSQRKNSRNLVITPSPHSLIEQPGTGTGAASPEGEAAQGPSPSPIDYSLEVEADFLRDLVSMMKENAAKKARRTIIGRTVGGKATLKSLLDCLKLHLSIPLVSITLLTRGYFEILFEEEEGAKATRRLATIEWSGLSFSFSRYAPNFDVSFQGAEAQLTHAIRVQFLDLHEEFKNTKALTLMASKLGEVLEIKAADSYIKRPAGPMITIELRDISKLPRGTNGKELRGAGAPQWSKAQAVKQLRAQNARRGQEHAGTNQKQPKASKQAGHPAQPNIRTSSDVLPNAGAAPRNTMDASESLEADQAMADPATPPGPRQGKPNPMAGTRPENPLLEQPNFGYRESDNQKEILINVKSNDLPNLPPHIRCMSASEEDWTPTLALEDLTRSVESKLEEKILRFSLSLKGRLALEWSWQEDQTKGGWECTILGHINTSLSGISAQKRKNLHWRTLESIMSMNNNVVFVGPAHGLLVKTGPASMDRQTRKSTSTSLLASPQAARKKKRYVKLDLSTLVPSNPPGLFQASQSGEDTGQGDQESARYDHMGSISQSTTRKHSSHV
ncbi:unnamed protein product [Sphagnum tenellum]